MFDLHPTRKNIWEKSVSAFFVCVIQKTKLLAGPTQEKFIIRTITTMAATVNV